MLEERATQMRVGIFVLAGCALAALIIFMLGGERAWFQRKYELRCRFSDTSGLLIGAPVHLAGVKVGAVAAIHFPEALEAKEIEVILRIGRAYRERIRRDSVATISTQGLLGDKFISLSVGSAAEPAMAPGATVPSQPSHGLTALVERGNAVADEVQRAAVSLRTFLEGRSETGLAHALLYDPHGGEILADMAKGARSLRHLQDIVGDLQASAADVRALTGQVRRGEGSLGELLNDPALYNDLRTLFGRANRNFLLKAIVRAALRENDRHAAAQ